MWEGGDEDDDDEDIPLGVLTGSNTGTNNNVKGRKRGRPKSISMKQWPRFPVRSRTREEPLPQHGVLQYAPTRKMQGEGVQNAVVTSTTTTKEPLSTSYYGSAVLGPTAHPFPELVFPEELHRLPSVAKALEEMIGAHHAEERLDALSVRIVQQMALRIVTRVVPALMEALQGDTSLRCKGICESTLRVLRDEADRASTTDVSLARVKVLLRSIDVAPKE